MGWGYEYTRDGRGQRDFRVKAHVYYEDGTSDEDFLDDIMAASEDISDRKPDTRLTFGIIGDVGADYPTGYGLVTTLRGVRSAYRRATGYQSDIQVLAGLELAPPGENNLYTFYAILSDGGIERPEEVTDVWIENSTYRRGP